MHARCQYVCSLEIFLFNYYFFNSTKLVAKFLFGMIVASASGSSRNRVCIIMLIPLEERLVCSAIRWTKISAYWISAEIQYHASIRAAVLSAQLRLREDHGHGGRKTIVDCYYELRKKQASPLSKSHTQY